MEQTFGGHASSPAAAEARAKSAAAPLRGVKSSDGLGRVSPAQSPGGSDLPARPASVSGAASATKRGAASPPKSKRVSASLPLTVFTESVVYGALPTLQVTRVDIPCFIKHYIFL